MPEKKEDLIAFLAAVADDRCCPVCYYVYLKKYLCRKDRKRLYLVSTDCDCDFKSDSSNEDITERPEDSETV